MGFQDRIAALKPRYLERSSQRLADLAPMLNGVGRDGGELHAMRFVFHDIAGTAGTFGYDDIGRVARLADDVLSARAEVGGPMPDSEAVGLRTLAEQLQAMLAKASGT
jgi:chemotaxis protein histidine kinase CheA